MSIPAKTPPSSKVPPPITRDQVPPEWIELRYTIAQREGRALRGGEGNTIEVKSLTNDHWHALCLPRSAVAFTTAEARDDVLQALATKKGQTP